MSNKGVNMSKPKHTPGPWEVYIPQSSNRIWIESKTESLFDVLPHVGKNQMQANAQLISAAPDLLSICIWLQKHAQPSLSSSELHQLDLAIAKAKGTNE
jgi:hypothetical protein